MLSAAHQSDHGNVEGQTVQIIMTAKQHRKQKSTTCTSHTVVTQEEGSTTSPTHPPQPLYLLFTKVHVGTLITELTILKSVLSTRSKKSDVKLQIKDTVKNAPLNSPFPTRGGAQQIILFV